MKDEIIGNLIYLVKTYDGVTRHIAKSKQRLLSLMPDADVKHQFDVIQAEALKGKIKREIGKVLMHWDIWTEWLKHVPGCGEFIAGNLITLWYYKHVPVCKKCGCDLEEFTCTGCGEKASGDGLLAHRIVMRDFAKISAWWHFMGRHIVDGKMPKRAKGVQVTWSTIGRTIGYQFGDQVNRQQADNPYKQFMVHEKESMARNERHKDKSKGHIHNMARNNTVKLFLSHFWQVARTLDKKPLTDPYPHVHQGHQSLILPYFWDKPLGASYWDWLENGKVSKRKTYTLTEENSRYAQLGA